MKNNLSPKFITYKVILSATPILIFIFSFWVSLLGFREGPNLTIFTLVCALVFFGISYLTAKLTYKFYLYELADNGFKKESGIIWKRYVTIPYEKIQNVDITRGVIERILGLSTLKIQTAGASAPMIKTSMGIFHQESEGLLPGLDEKTAEELRDELVRRSSNK